MKKIFLFCALVVLQIVVKAQKVYFIYLQTENATPFYVRVGGQIQSSSTEGYLIIPSLKDSTYQISIGQPGKQGEPRFAITINKTDRGFLIRTVDGNISLFDLQTLSVYKPISSETTFTKSVLRTDNFTRLLALVADDSTLLMEPMVAVVKEQQSQPKETIADVAVVREIVKPSEDVVTQSSPNSNVTPEKATQNVQNKPAVTESADEKKPVAEEKADLTVSRIQDTAINTEDVSAVVENKSTSDANEIYKKSVVIKKSESSTSEGFGLVFLDEYRGTVDTIQLIIPNPSFVLPDTTQKQVAEIGRAHV